ncbi:uncharacterized protein [Eurosta solidaginis]
MCSICQYSIGMAHLVSVKIWQFIIEYCNQDHTLYVVREARHLLYDILYKYDVKTKDTTVVKEVLEEITKPLTENVFEVNNERIMVNVEDHELQHKLSATLDLLSFVFQQTLESKEKTNIVNICQVEQNIELTAWKLVDMYYNEDFILKVLSTLSSYYFAKFLHDKWNGDEQQQIDSNNFNELGIAVYNQMKFCIERNYCVNFLRIAEINHKLWKKLGTRVPKQVYIENELVRFESQLIIFQLIPVHMILRLKEFEEEEFFQKYMMKIFALTCDQTLRICYTYRDSILKMPKSTSIDLSIKSVYGTMSMVDILERDEAIIVFQACIYALKEFIIKLYESNGMALSLSQTETSFTIVAEYANTIHAILVSMKTLIERFKITWNDSIETICLVSCAMQLLLAKDLPIKVCVQALKLLQLSIEHFLSPDMALLVDDLHESSFTRMAPIIKNRAHDTNWEVRDSILELVISIANIAHIKYPAFQKILAENWICKIVQDMAINDTEPYVRASAIKCIAELVAIDCIFDDDFSTQDIFDHMVDTIYNEPEGIVRKEAICALARLTRLSKIPTRYSDTYFSIIAYVIDNDLYWEAKVEAINCLRYRICYLLTNEGMLDGTFPSVTFSKEKKKIVQLNPREVNLRFFKVLTELSQRGVLGLLLKSIQDDCDIAVIRASRSLAKKMLNKMEQHNFTTFEDKMEPTSNSNISSTTNFINPLTANIATSDKVKVEESSPKELFSGDAKILEVLDSDEIIESILNSQDINLLAETYNENMNINEQSGNSEAMEANLPQRRNNKRRQIDPLYYKKFSIVGPIEFVAALMAIDFEEKTDKQDQWFLCDENFATLLDEILCMVKPEQNSESISADCY